MLNDDAAIADFLKRLDNGEVDGWLNLKLSQLSYSQLLTLTPTPRGA